MCAGALMALQASGQSLTEAVTTTLRTNPEILASRYNASAAEQLHKQARGAYFPSLDLVLASGEENSNNTTTRAAGRGDLSMTREENSIRLTQLLYDGGYTGNHVRQQSALSDAAIEQLSSTKENTGLTAIQVYLEVLRRDSVVALAKENLRHHDDTLTKIHQRFESGVGTKVDVVQTRGRQAQSKSNVLLAERDSANGRANFYRVVGENPSNLREPSAPSGLPGTLQAAIEIAMNGNPGLKAVEAELEAASAARKQARGAFHPRFDLELGATRNDDTDGSSGPNEDETAVIRMTLNLYRGGADRARSRETEAREFAAREAVNHNRRLVQENVTVIWNELEDIRMRLQFLEAHVKSTEEVLVVYNEQLSLGKRTLLDLLDVQNELLRAKVALVSGRYAERLAEYRVLGAIGQLLESMGLSKVM
ncbi:MAG: hypothetical protein CMQ29_11745 [Gammaproteobacteria bacterium]|nr:hypothetical protein [Gammaproteobacteria bacterium]